jgi:PAS domain S-box-containing protein
MSSPLQILHLEDDPDYSSLVQALLTKEGIDAAFTVVSNEADFEAALDLSKFDLILADYLVPAYNGIAALRYVRSKHAEIPFLLISGTIGEQAAIESLRSGATDYVLKHWPERLVPAIRRAIEESQERARRRHVETELLRREKYFRALTENALDIVTVVNPEGLFHYNSPSLVRVLGYNPQGVAGHSALKLVHPEDVDRVRAAFQRALANPEQTVTLQFRFRHRDGSWRYLEAVAQNRLSEPEIGALVINSRDITDRKQAEEDIRENEKQYRLIFDGNPIPMWVFDHETLAFLEVNDAACQHYGFSRQEFLGMTIEQIRTEQEIPALIEYLHRLMEPGNLARPSLTGVWQHRKKDGSLIDVEVKWSPISFKGRAASLTMANDITERRRIEHRDAALAKLGQSLSSATTPAEAAEIIRTITDDLFRWDVFTLDLYSSEEDQIRPLLNVDTDRSGSRFFIPVSGQDRQPSRMARRVIAQGAELILRDEPVRMSGDSVPIGDTSRASASLMLAPVRNRTKVIGILSIQSYSLKAYAPTDLVTLQTLADHCGGALERIRAEQALHKSEQRFRDLFEGSPDAIFVEDFEGTVLDVNPAACRLHGVRREDLIGKSVAQLVPPD